MATHVYPHLDTDGDNTAQAVGNGLDGSVYHVEVHNANTSVAYIQFFDALAANVTVGTTTPIQTYMVPPGDGATPGTAEKHLYNSPMKFEKGMTYACTTTATGNGDPTTGLVVNILYR